MSAWDQLQRLVEAPAAKPIRANPAQGDPLKDTHAEHFHTDQGDYFLIKHGNQYDTIFIPFAQLGKFSLGPPTVDRRAAVNLALAHHDKTAAGVK